jgi:hypothetical protein
MAVHDGYHEGVIAEPRPAPNDDDGRDEPTGLLALPEGEVWSLLGRADVVLRGILAAQGREERRIWEERAQAWLREVNRAWVESQPPVAVRVWRAGS